ncbi:MAG TPA: hypothetical protein DDE71_04235 [Tenacibaculum sp.]|nr:hypothetical protein [Tenacibaculum sp.]
MYKTLKIPKAFLSFLIASILFWLLMNLSKEYVTEINLDVSFKNIEQGKLILNNPPDEISLSVSAVGFKLLGTSLFHKPLVVDLKNLIKKTDSTYFLLSKNLIPEIQNQLKSGLVLKNINQDSIFFKINKLHSKKVKIITDININFKKGFDLASSQILTPNTISIYGPKSILDTINFLKTEKIRLLNISDDVKMQANILIPDKVTTRYKTTTLNFKVDKFTEGRMEIPITVINLPPQKTINIYPKTVSLIYKIGLKDFNKVDSDFFSIHCDYKECQKNKLPYLIPELKSKANIVSSVRIIPNKIDFLISK